MKRKIIIPFSGDPFVFNLSNMCLKKISSLVDDIYVYYDSGMLKKYPEVETFFNHDIDHLKIISEERKCMFFPDEYVDRGVHGKYLRILASHCDPTDYVCFLEEDCIIFDPTIIDRCFKLLEDELYDMVGSFRGFCTPEIMSEFKRIYCNSPWAVKNPHMFPGFWPNLFFIKAENLFKTNGEFGSKDFDIKQPIPYLNNFKPDKPQSLDIFVNTSLRLYSMGLNPYYIDQHCMFDCINFCRFDSVPYVHVMSLSSGVNCYLRHEGLKQSLKGHIFYDPIVFNQDITTLSQNLTKNVLMWNICYEIADKRCIPNFAKDYQMSIKRLSDFFGYKSPENIAIILNSRIHNEILI